MTLIIVENRHVWREASVNIDLPLLKSVRIECEDPGPWKEGQMAGKRHTAEQIVRKLREAEIELAKGQSIKTVCKKLQITDQTYYRWRKEYGGLQVNQARRLKDLERQNARLKRLLAEAELDKAILKEVAEGNF
jgi:transposase-like protein